MSYFSDPCFSNYYQFAGWSPTLTRPARISSGKKTNDALTSSIDQRKPFENLTKQHLLHHTVIVPTESQARSPSPPYQPAPTPDLYSIDDQASLVSSIEPPLPYFTSVRLQSAILAVPLKTTGADSVTNRFAKESHERRKVVHERKLRKQQVKKYPHVDSDVWLQLRQSPAPLTRLTGTNGELIESSTSQLNGETYSFETLKQAIHQQQNERKTNNDKSEADSRPASTLRSRTNASSLASRPRSAKRPTETFLQPIFEPFIVAAKPIHSVMLTSHSRSSKIPSKLTKSAPQRIGPSSRVPFAALSTPLPASDVSIVEPLPAKPPIVKESTPTDPPVVTEVSTRPKTASTASIKSTIKLDNQVPRCRSANASKPSPSSSKVPVRFILITDDEHRIESWYHRYPFIIATDFLQSFELKSNPSTIPAYFTDDHQHSIDLNRMSKGHLQDRPFHRENDWKKYDLILISQKIYADVTVHLQSIIRSLAKSSGKTIDIRQVNQTEDLKAQVTLACKQVNQQSESHA